MKQFKKIFGLLVVCVTMLSMVFMVQAAVHSGTVEIYDVMVGETLKAGTVVTYGGGCTIIYNGTQLTQNEGETPSLVITRDEYVVKNELFGAESATGIYHLETKPVNSPNDDSDNEPTQAELTNEEVKAELAGVLKALKDNATEIKGITGGGACAAANTNAAEKLESLFRREKIGFTTIELEKGKVLVPVVDIKLLKMDGKFSYVLNDMAVGSDLYLQFKGTDEKLYSVPCTKLTPSAINRIYFTEPYLTVLAVK